MTKINLSALKKDNKNLQEDSSTQNNENTNSQKEAQTVRISLKDLKIYPKEVKKENSVEENEVEKTNETIIQQEEVNEVSMQEESIDSGNVEIQDVPNEKIVSLSSLKMSEEIKEEKNEKKEPVVVSILDSDSNFTIVQEEKNEIFSNYKGSYSENKAEDKKVEAKKAVKEEKKEETKVVEKVKEDKTNLEKYKDGQKKERKFKIKFNKKIVSGLSVFLIFTLGGSLAFLNNSQLKTNILESLNIQTNINNQNDNGAIVKENDLSNIDNVEKSSKINKNIENYLLKKYKNN